MNARKDMWHEWGIVTGLSMVFLVLGVASVLLVYDKGTFDSTFSAKEIRIS